MKVARQRRRNLTNTLPTLLAATGIEACITGMLTRMQTGRFKVFKSQNAWTDEFRYYGAMRMV